jgi:hypothetical protein
MCFGTQTRTRILTHAHIYVPLECQAVEVAALRAAAVAAIENDSVDAHKLTYASKMKLSSNVTTLGC